MMQLVLIFVIYIIASFTQGVTGFGFGVFATPMISLVFSPGVAVGMNAVLGTVNCTYNYFLLREYVDYKKSAKLFAVSLLFIPLGAYFLVSVMEEIVFLAMGTMVVVVTLHSMQQHRVKADSIVYTKLGFVFPVLAGSVAGAFAAPGPILAPYMFAREKDPFVAKANLQFIFSLMSIIIIASHTVAGNLSVDTLLLSLPYIPLVFLFTKIGAAVSFKLKKELFRRVEYSALLLLGAYLIFQNLTKLLSFGNWP